jgi:hypothetical protein
VNLPTGTLLEKPRDVVELVADDGSRQTFLVLDRLGGERAEGGASVLDVEDLAGNRHWLHRLGSGRWALIA